MSAMPGREGVAAVGPAPAGRGRRDDHWLAGLLRGPHRAQTARRLRLLCVCVALLGAAALRSLIGLALDPAAHGLRDFALDYRSARALLAGSSPYTVLNPDLGISQPHPPFAAALFAPFAIFDPATAGLLWLALSLLLLFGTLLVMARELRWRAGAPWLVAATLALVLWPPLTYDLAQGTPNLAMVFLVTLGWSALRRGRDGTAGACLGAAAAIKLLPVVVLFYLVMARRIRAVAAGGATGALLTFLSLPGGDLGVARDFLFRVTPDNARVFLAFNYNISPHGLVARLFVPSVWSQPPIEAPAVYAVFAVLWTLLVLGSAAYFAHRLRSGERTIDLEYAFAVTAMLVVTPLTWTYYFPFLLLPAALWARWLGEQGAGGAARVFLLAAVLVSLPQTTLAALLGWTYTPLPLGPALVLRLPLVGLLLLFGLGIHALRSAPGPGLESRRDRDDTPGGESRQCEGHAPPPLRA